MTYEPTPTMVVGITIAVDDVRRLDALAEAHFITRAAFARSVILQRLREEDEPAPARRARLEKVVA